MFRRIADKTSSFRRDGRGVVLVLFAVLIMPILLLLAVAIDLSQFLVMKQQLQAAVDAAALNIGKTPDMSAAAATAQAQAYVAANYPAATSIGTLVSVKATPPTGATNPTVTVQAQASMNTSFLQLAGYSTLSVQVSSTTTIKENKIEVVLVLDNTGSMADPAGDGDISKIQGLINAATSLTDILFGSNETSQYVKIGVVPFTAAVNVGPQYATATWIDATGAGVLTTENLNVTGGLLSLFGGSQLQNSSWRGCVRQRNEPYDTSETPPTTGDTLFTPYFAPSEPTGNYTWNGQRWTSANPYLPDDATGTPQAIQRSVAKYANGKVANGSDGPNFLCPVKQILLLTNDKQTVLDEINGMSPYGNTVIPSGLMWGWHLISPKFWPFATVDAQGNPVPALYSDDTTIKAIVLVTDGDNDVSSGSNGFNKSYFSAYGYAGAGGHLTSTTNPSLTPEQVLDQKYLALCSNIKAIKTSTGADRILLYMIALGSDINSTSKQNMAACATDATTYFTATTTDELLANFQQIAIGLNQLRISQ